MFKQRDSDHASSRTSTSSSWGQPAATAIGASSSHFDPRGTSVVVVVVVGATVVVVVVVVVGGGVIVVVEVSAVVGTSCVLTGPLQFVSSSAPTMTALVRVSLRNSLLLDRGYGKALLLG